MSQYIFLDESGDLGFDKRKRSSKYFLITILFTKDKKTLEKIVKKTHQTLRKKVKKLSGGVLHAVKERPITRKRLLQSVAASNCSIMVIYLNKLKVYTKLQNEKHVLYNYVTNILLDRVFSKELLDTKSMIHLVAERRETNRFLNENFQSYLKGKMHAEHKLHLSVDIRTPSEEKSLQIVDFISWAIFRKYELKDESYYQIIEGCIIEENSLFG